MDNDGSWRDQPVAVLCSGGLDSAILVGELLPRCPRVLPIYVHFGLVWEDAEEAGLRSFLAAIACPALSPLKVFHLSAGDVYDAHWSTTGQGTPDQDTPDNAVFLPGRNLLLLAQAAIWCSLHAIPTIAMAPLKGNPFPDADDDFFAAYESVIARSVDRPVTVVRPYKQLSKREVMLRGADLPLEKTFSCINPRGQLHCGRCNKCAERRKAFADAGMADPTTYALPDQSEDRHVSCYA